MYLHRVDISCLSRYTIIGFAWSKELITSPCTSSSLFRLSFDPMSTPSLLTVQRLFIILDDSQQAMARYQTHARIWMCGRSTAEWMRRTLASSLPKATGLHRSPALTTPASIRHTTPICDPMVTACPWVSAEAGNTICALIQSRHHFRHAYQGRKGLPMASGMNGTIICAESSDLRH